MSENRRYRIAQLMGGNRQELVASCDRHRQLGVAAAQLLDEFALRPGRNGVGFVTFSGQLLLRPASAIA
jgi:hypothetical protein